MTSDLTARYTATALERDHIRRLFNRLEAAVSHHRRATEGHFRNAHDEALYAARDKVLSDYADGNG